MLHAVFDLLIFIGILVATACLLVTQAGAAWGMLDILPLIGLVSGVGVLTLVAVLWR